MMNGLMKKMNGNQVLISDQICSKGRSHGIKSLLELTKVHLSLYIALSAVTGHVLAQHRLTPDSFLFGTWVLLLSAGSGVLNNIQDRIYDASFTRTQNRALVKKNISLIFAKRLAGSLMGIGLLGLFSFGPLPMVLGLTAVALYNGVYTPMKKKWRFTAMIPGTICGMIPPAMGWVAVVKPIAVADLSGLFIVMAALGFWQLPHYLLIYLKQGLADRQIQHQVLIWTCLFSLCILLFLIQGWIASPILGLVLFTAALTLPFAMGGCLFFQKPSHRYLDISFWAINLSMLLFLATIMLDRV